MEEVSQPELFEDAAAISDGGERVSHLQKDLFFYAQLSIYDFAAHFCQDALVLDAGSGAGYGAAHLADAGARHVSGIDLSPKAVAFSRHHFRHPNLDFRAGSVEELPFESNSFDFVFTSNTLEHVHDVARFLHAAHRVLRLTGSMLVAVPPITNDELMYVNVVNPHHVNIWSPRQWEFVLSQFFGEVDAFLHGVWEVGLPYTPELAASRGEVTEKNFVFGPGSVDDMYRIPTVTAIFLAKTPRPVSELPAPGSPLVFVDDSFSRTSGRIDRPLRRRLQPNFEDAQRSPIEMLKLAWAVWRTEGTRVLLRDTLRFLGRALRGEIRPPSQSL